MNQIQWLQAQLNKLIRENALKGCFISLPTQCEQTPIKAHSVSKGNHLRRIAENGQVLMPKVGPMQTGLMEPIGNAAASTFPGFCDEHDKLFAPIDEGIYTIGNREFEFLCAMRAAARERFAKGTQHNLAQLQKEASTSEFAIAYATSVALGLQDVEADRRYFNHNLLNNRFDRIRTIPLIFPSETPVVASSMFMPQIDFDGNLVNDLSDPAAKIAAVFLTIFPEEGRSIVLLSYKATSESKLGFLNKISDMDLTEQKIIISNLLAGFVENMAVSPTYWESLAQKGVVDLYEESFMKSVTMEVVPLVLDKRINIFL